MQKKLLATAIGAALAAPMMVQADVTVYGIAQFEWAQVTNDGTNDYVYRLGAYNNSAIPAVTGGSTKGVGIDNAMGRFGIKASEDLGGGLTGFAQFEFQTDTADNGYNNTVVRNSAGSGTTTVSSPIAARSSFVGLGYKPVGSIRFGRDATPYAVLGTSLDPFVGTTLEARNNYGMNGGKDGFSIMNGNGGYVNDTVFFNSASFGGAYINASFGLEKSGADNSCSQLWSAQCSSGKEGSKSSHDMSLAGGWKGAAGPVGLHVFAAYMKMGSVNEVTTPDTVNTDAPTAIKVGVQTTFAKDHTVSFQYEKNDMKAQNWTDPAVQMFLGYKGNFGPVTAVVQAGKMNADQGSNSAGYDYEGKYLAVGAIYNLSKTFRVFGGYRNTTLDASPVWSTAASIRDETVLSLGMRKDF